MLTTKILLNEKEQLEKDIADMEPKRKRLALVVELLKLYPDAEGQPVLFTTPQSDKPGRYASLGTSDAMMSFLREKPFEFFTPREISAALIAGGIKVNSENFNTTVHTTCKRKAEQGILECGEKEGRKAFRMK